MGYDGMMGEVWLFFGMDGVDGMDGRTSLGCCGAPSFGGWHGLMVLDKVSFSVFQGLHSTSPQIQHLQHFPSYA